MSNFIFSSYLGLGLAWFLYSYGFVDFNLTLSSNRYILAFVSEMQQLALFNRPSSLGVYLLLISLLFLLYLLTLRLRLTVLPWKQLLILGTIFCLSYPLLSSDVFKYLFSARTLIEYGANPHVVAPQVFEGDTWLRFMRWIHTPSPYGPIQTVLALPYYLLGLGKFVPTLYLYKIDQLFWYALSIWSIAKLGGSVRSQLFFALNPLVLIEWLINAHNDAPMISLALLSLVLLKQKQRFLGFLSLLLSTGVKFVTVIFLPLFFLKKHPETKVTAVLSTVTLTLIPLLYHYQVQYQPWYVTWIIPFVALTASPRLWCFAAAYSLGALLRYIPYISYGVWKGSLLTFGLLTFLPPILICLSYNWIHAAVSPSKKT